MKGEKVSSFFKTTALKLSGVVLAAAVLAGSSVWYETTQLNVPELVTFVDTDGSVSIPEEEVPLAAPKVTTSTKTKKTVKTVKLKAAAKKSYTTKSSSKKSSTKKSSKKSKTTTKTTTTKTVVATTVSKKYTKKSRNMKQTTTTKTTVTKTVVTTKNATTAKNGTVTLSASAPKLQTNVKNAFEKMGFKVTVNSSVSYSGLFDAKSRTITLKKADETIYHEMGHFVAFAAGNADTTSSFKKIFESEKGKYTEYNKAYVLANSSEYFAESYKNFVENPTKLKASRPQTYQAIENAVNAITDKQVAKIIKVYSAIWK